MDSDKFLRPIEMREMESAAHISENLAFQQTILDIQASNPQTIQQLNETIIGLNATIGGNLIEGIALLKGPKKNSHNSSVPPPEIKTGH